MKWVGLICAHPFQRGGWNQCKKKIKNKKEEKKKTAATSKRADNSGIL